MDNNHDNTNGHQQQQQHHSQEGHKEYHRTKKKISHNNNNDMLLASKIDVLLQQHQPVAAVTSSSSPSSTSNHHHHNGDNHGSSSSKKKKKKHQSSNNSCSSNCNSIHAVYANECQVIALILLSRIQDFNIYIQSWQKHEYLATIFLPQLVLQQQQQPAVVENDNNNDDKDNDDDYYDYYSLSLHTHWIHLVSHLLSRFDQTVIAAIAAAAAVEDDDNTTINNVLLSPSIVVVVDALTEILLTLLLNDETATSLLKKMHKESKNKSSLLRNHHHHHHLLQEAHVEAIMSISCALDIAFSPLALASSSPTTTLNNVDRILSCIWACYHDTACNITTATEQPLPFSATTTPPTDHDDDDSKTEIKMIPKKEKHYDIMLQTLTAMWNNDEQDSAIPAETTTSSQENDAAAVAVARLLDACWYILSLYGARMANSSSNNSRGPTSTSMITLPSFWKLTLEWWCRAHHQPKDNNKLILVNHHGHYLAWAEFLLQIIQQPGTHGNLQQLLLLLPVVAADDSLKRGGGDNIDNVDSSSSSSCSIAQNLFQLLLACIVSPEQQAAVQPLATAPTALDDASGMAENDTDKQPQQQPPQQQPNNRALRPLAWTCLTNLLQSEKIGWDWLLLMETTTKSSSSSSSTNNRGRHLTTMVRLAVGEWKIQLGYYLVAGENLKHDKAGCQQQQKQEDCETLIQVCGQFIVQTVQFIAQLADDVMDHDNDDSKRRALPLLSATNINHLRRSLDEALDAAVQYLGLHPEQHGRAPQVDACVIRVLGSLLTEMNVFDQQLQRRPQKQPSQQQQQGQDDYDENDNATLHALRIAMELTTKSNKNTSKASSVGGDKVSLQEHEGYPALMPSLAYVLASAEGDEHCVQLLKDYNVLDRDIMLPFLHSFWNQQRQEDLETFASVVPWCCQVIELYVGLVTVAETELLQADLIAWIRSVLQQLPLSSSSPASEQQQVLVKSLESVVSCYVTLQGEIQPPEPDLSIIQHALEACARCLSSEKDE